MKSNVVVSVNKQYVKGNVNDLITEISQIIIEEIVAELDKDSVKLREL